MFKQEYVVQLVVESTHQYNVQAASEEEAVALAEKEYEDGNVGVRLGFDVQMADGFCTDSDLADAMEDGDLD